MHPVCELCMQKNSILFFLTPNFPLIQRGETSLPLPTPNSKKHALPLARMFH